MRGLWSNDPVVATGCIIFNSIVILTFVVTYKFYIKYYNYLFRGVHHMFATYYKPSLQDMIRDKDYTALERALENTVSGHEVHDELNTTLATGDTLIHLAAASGDTRLLQILLAAGPLLDLRNDQYKLPKEVAKTDDIRQILEDAEIIVAAWNGDIDKVKTLRSQGKSPYIGITISTSGITMQVSALSCAKFKKYQDIIDLLMNQSEFEIPTKPTYIKQDGPLYRYKQIDLCLAIENNELHRVRQIILDGKKSDDCCMSVNYLDMLSKKYQMTPTPLSLAAARNNASMAKALLQLGADKNDEHALAMAKCSRSDDLRQLFGLPAFRGHHSLEDCSLTSASHSISSKKSIKPHLPPEEQKKSSSSQMIAYQYTYAFFKKSRIQPLIDLQKPEVAQMLKLILIMTELGILPTSDKASEPMHNHYSKSQK